MVKLSAFICLIWITAYGQNACLQKESLLERDRWLAKMAADIGMLNAFDRFMMDDATLIPQFGHPIQGKESFGILRSEFESQKKDAARWNPIFADVSRTGDLGYTLGRYPLPARDSTAQEEIDYNYYISMWKKTLDGAWKLYFHVGLLNLKCEDAPVEEGEVVLEFSEQEKPIVEIDRAFSRLSAERGYPEAFYRNIADDGLALSGNGRPPSNRDRYRRMVESYQDKEKPPFELVWEPIFASMSSSGELGCTHGRWKSVSLDAEGKENCGYGYYLSVWKKQTDGRWKFVLDGGNESPYNGFSGDN